MAVNRIPAPSAEERQIASVNKFCRKGNKVLDIGTSQNLACLLVTLDADVTPADYADMRNDILAVRGFSGVHLLVDGQTPATIPDGTQIDVVCEVRLRIVPAS